MSISDAIAATSPNLWWKLDEGSGTVAHNSGSLANDGTVTGTVQWDINGPEFGTTAIRLYNDAAITSLGMDVTNLAPYSLGMWISTDASGPTGTQYAIASIGDVTNRLARGMFIGEGHAVVGTPLFSARWNGTSYSQGTPAEPRKFWHWVVLTVNTGSNNVKLYVNGTAAAPATATAPIAALSTDPLLLACAEPVALAHVCFWAGVLTPVQISSVWEEMAFWPYTVPVNTPPSVTGGGGELPPETSEQLDRIEGYVDDLPGVVDAVSYISGKVNEIDAAVEALDTLVHTVNGKVDEALAHLNTLLAVTGEQEVPLLNEILDSVSRVFTTFAGVGLHTPIGNILAHPDPNLQHATADAFVISGRGTLVPPGPLQWGNVFGIRWLATTVPPKAGRRNGIIPSFERRLVQWVLWWPDAETLVLHPQEIAEFRWEAFTYLWTRPYPNTIQYDVAPGFELTCRYMIIG